MVAIKFKCRISVSGETVEGGWNSAVDLTREASSFSGEIKFDWRRYLNPSIIIRLDGYDQRYFLWLLLTFHKIIKRVSFVPSLLFCLASHSISQKHFTSFKKDVKNKKSSSMT